MDHGKIWGNLTDKEQEFVKKFLSLRNLDLVARQMKMDSVGAFVMKNSLNVDAVITHSLKWIADNSDPKSIKEQHQDLEDIYAVSRFGTIVYEYDREMESTLPTLTKPDLRVSMVAKQEQNKILGYSSGKDGQDILQSLLNEPEGLTQLQDLPVESLDKLIEFATIIRTRKQKELEKEITDDGTTDE